MKIPLPYLVLLVAILVQMATSFPAAGGRDRPKYASWDDVNVVAHGLLQLGHGLKDHVEKTKVQMRDISAKLRAFNSTVTELARQSPEQGEALRTKAQEIEERESRVVKLSAEVTTRVEELRKELLGIHDRMDKLEDRLDGMLQGQGLKNSNNKSSNYSDFLFIQHILGAQNKRIDDLVESIRQQQDKLEKQNINLQALHEKVTKRKSKSLFKPTVAETALRGSTEQSNAPTGLASDCHELFLRGERDNGVYIIQPPNSQPFNVLCEITSEGGWTVIQKRQDGSQNFNKLWEAYQKGFGDLRGEFWLGLENFHTLSKQGHQTLEVELSDWRGEAQSVQYQFRLDGEESDYTLHLHQGSPKDLESALTSGTSGLPFSTSDRDHDLRADINCAKHLSGGWWFSNCGNSNLNGKYPRKTTLIQRQQSRRQLIFWKTLRGHYNPLKTTVLKISPTTIKS